MWIVFYSVVIMVEPSNVVKPWFAYILQCADDSLYTGVTIDVIRRVEEHNSDNKKGARYTRVRRPVTLVYREQCDNRADACQREAAIKKLTRQQKLNLIRSDNNELSR